MSKLYKWLKDKCDEHNSKLSYVDYEESWHPIDFILSVITHGLAIPASIAVLAYSMDACLTLNILLPLGYSLVNIVYLFWHLLKY